VAEPPGRRPETRPPGAVVARNAAAAGLRYAVSAVVALWVTGFMLHVVGPAQFGVWALAGALLPVLRLADLGLGRALTRAVAEALGRGDPAAAAPAVGAARVVAVLVAVAAAGVVWCARGWLVQVAGIPPDLVAVATYVLVGTAVVAGAEGVFAPYQAALEGLGRLDLTSGVDTVQRLASAAGVVLVLTAGWGLPGLVWKNVATALGAGLAYRALLARHGPALAAAPARAPRAEVRALLTFGRHVQAVNLAALAVEPVTKTLLSRYVGLDAVALWDLALRVVGQVAGGFLALVAALFPAAAEQRARAAAAGTAALGTLYRQSARYVTWLVLPVFGLLAALAGPFVLAWLGPAYTPVALAIVGMSAGWVVALLAQPAFLLAQAGGHERLSTAAGLTTAAVALALTLVWIPRFGLAGAVTGYSLGLVAGGLVALALFARRLHLGPGDLAVLDGRAWLAAGLAAAGAGLLARALPASWVIVIGSGLLGVAAYVGLLMALGGLTPGERAWVRGWLAAWRRTTGPAG
jgi:O-antigen/teichoic acid export membrane protein